MGTRLQMGFDKEEEWVCNSGGYNCNSCSYSHQSYTPYLYRISITATTPSLPKHPQLILVYAHTIGLDDILLLI